MEGRKNKAYYNSGTYTVPVWEELKRISDLKRGASRSANDYNYRGAENVKTATGQKKNDIAFKYHTKRDPVASATDAVLVALLDSFNNGTVLDMAFMNQAIATTGAKGVRGPFVVVDMPRDESDGNNTSYDVTLAEVDHEESGALVELAAFTTA